MSSIERRLSTLEAERPENIVVTIRGGLPDERAEQNLATVGGLEYHREPDEGFPDFRARMRRLAVQERGSLILGGLPE